MIKRIVGCKNNFEKSSTTKVGEHIPCEYSVSTVWIFDGMENTHNVYRGEDYVKKFCESLWNHAMKINNFEKKKMIPLTKEQWESYENANEHIWTHGWLGEIQWNTLPEKEDFYSHLNKEDIPDADYTHARRVCKDFKIRNLGEYHDLYVQCDTLLLADVFNSFWNMRLEIYCSFPSSSVRLITCYANKLKVWITCYASWMVVNRVQMFCVIR